MTKPRRKKSYIGYLDWNSELPKKVEEKSIITFGNKRWFTENYQDKSYETKVIIIVEEIS